MTPLRGLDPSQSMKAKARIAHVHEDERRAHSGRLGTGTLACRHCDAPVAVGVAPMSITDELTCPFCRARGVVRDFLSLGPPTRPARVVVRVIRARSSA